MTHQYFERSLEPVLLNAAARFPAVVLTGPRQSGKTTLLKHMFAKRCGYVSLEPPDIRSAAIEDPRAFLELHPPPVIFDEVQYAPGLLPYVKERIDARRHISGQYLLAGSQDLLLMQQVSESLAGRAGMFRLLPLSRREARKRSLSDLPWKSDVNAAGSVTPESDGCWERILRGGYPELEQDPGRDTWSWHASYVQTYLERDLRTLMQVGDLSQFHSFLRALAARSAQLLNLSDLARDLGIAVNTAKNWLSILEAGFQVIVLRPYYGNLGKRLVKSPKVYFTDTGTLCYLTGLKDVEHASRGPMGGAIMETAVLSEIYKSILHQGLEPGIHFWRTRAGAEVDFLVEWEGKLVPVEAKLNSTPRPGMASAIKRLRSDLGTRAGPGYVIHPGDARLPMGEGVTALPFSML